MIGGLQGEFGDLDIKYLKQKISKCRSQIQGSFRRISQPCKRAAKFRNMKDTILQPKADFAALRSWLSACGVRLPTVVTPSFQLRIVHRLKHWIANFLRFETTYSMHKLDFRKCSKSGCHKKCFMADFSLLPLLAFQICLWQRTSKLWFFMFLSFSLLFHGFQITLFNLILLW